MFNTLYRIILHPSDVFQSIRSREKNYYPVAIVAVILLFFSCVAEYQLTDFAFNHNRTDRMNIWFMLFRTVVLFFLWILANWAFCSLFSGEGKLSQIFWLSALSLMPYIFAISITTLLSVFLTAKEGIFLTWILSAGQIYSGILMFAGLHIIHNFSMKKTILSVFFSLIGIAVILFLCVLLFVLFQQFSNFAVTIIKEIYRISGGG